MSEGKLQLVRQQDHKGCVLACMAMVTGQSYETVKENFGERLPRGFTHQTWGEYLTYRGYAIQQVFRYNAFENKPREPWPLAPWADVHLCAVDAGCGDGSHLVVMNKGGSVYDPMKDTVGSLSDYPSVNYIAAVFETGCRPAARAQSAPVTTGPGAEGAGS